VRGYHSRLDLDGAVQCRCRLFILILIVLIVLVLILDFDGSLACRRLAIRSRHLLHHLDIAVRCVGTDSATHCGGAAGAAAVRRPRGADREPAVPASGLMQG
jgi:hypothetical protein